MGITDQPIHVLHVEDDTAFAELVSVYLERDADATSVHTATAPDKGLDLLAATDIDCIVSDYDMPGMNGIEFLERVCEEYPELPFILYTGKGSEEVASEAISAGVTDYLEKERGTSQYTVLANRIHNAVEQYRSTRALEASQRRLSLLFEQSPLGVIEWTEEFEIAWVNDAGREILGYEEGDLAGTSWEAIVAGTERGEVGDIVEQLQLGDGGFHSINENLRADGESIICEWHNRLVTDDDGEIVTTFSQFQDITERRTRQQELEQHRALIHAANNAIITVDESNRVQSANAAVEEIFGYEPEELVGEPVTTLMSDDTATHHEAMFTRYLQTGERTQAWDDIEVEGRHRDGSRIPLSVTFGEFAQDGERLFVGIIRDITGESEYKRRRTQRRRVRTRLAETPSISPITVGLPGPSAGVFYFGSPSSQYGRRWRPPAGHDATRSARSVRPGRGDGGHRLAPRRTPDRGPPRTHRRSPQRRHALAAVRLRPAVLRRQRARL